MTEDVILCQEKAYTTPENDFTPVDLWSGPAPIWPLPQGQAQAGPVRNPSPPRTPRSSEFLTGRDPLPLARHNLIEREQIGAGSKQDWCVRFPGYFAGEMSLRNKTTAGRLLYLIGRPAPIWPLPLGQAQAGADPRSPDTISASASRLVRGEDLQTCKTGFG